LDLRTGEFGRVLAADAPMARSVALASDSGPIVAVLPGGRIRRYDPETGRSETTNNSFSSRFATISQESSAIVVADLNGILWRWKPTFGSPPEFRRAYAAVTALAVDGTGDKVLLGMDDGSVRLYRFTDDRTGEFPESESSPISQRRSRTPPAANRRKIVDDDVRFTVYRPQTLPPEVWASLLVFAHKTDLVKELAGLH
jgi:hypothetical protein